MSRLFSPDESEEAKKLFVKQLTKGQLFLDLPEEFLRVLNQKLSKKKRTTLKNRRRIIPRRRLKVRHPDQVEASFREKAKAAMPKQGWHWPYGYILLFWRSDWTKRRLNFSSKHTYEEVSKIMKEEWKTGQYYGAMLIRKTYEPRNQPKAKQEKT